MNPRPHENPLKKTSHRTHSFAAATVALLSAAACEGAGTFTVLLDPEGTITDGLEPGDEIEHVRDGWAVTYDKYVVVAGDIDLHFSTDEELEAEASDVFTADLTRLPANGLPLWELEELRAGRWDFSYATPGAAHGAERHDSVSEEDHEQMVDNDWTYLIDGLLMNPSGQSCPPAAVAEPGSKTPNGNSSGGNDCYDAPTVRFTFGATAETTFGPCEIDGLPGVAVTAGGTKAVAITIHGDHLFFNGFPEGGESGVLRLAQWMADCDLNLDGTVTQEELQAIAPGDLPEIDERYQLGGSPITPLENMYDYVRSQLKTQGHYQGEGECAIDGVEHDHEEDE